MTENKGRKALEDQKKCTSRSKSGCPSYKAGLSSGLGGCRRSSVAVLVWVSINMNHTFYRPETHVKTYRRLSYLWSRFRSLDKNGPLKFRVPQKITLNLKPYNPPLSDSFERHFFRHAAHLFFI